MDIETKKTRTQIDTLSLIDNVPAKKKIDDFFDRFKESESITIKSFCAIAIVSKSSLAKFLVDFYENFETNLSVYVKKCVPKLSELKFRKNHETVSISIIDIDKIKNGHIDERLEQQFSKIFDILKIEDIENIVDVNNLNDYASISSGLSKEAKELLYSLGIGISDKMYTIDEDMSSKTITINLKNYSRFIINSLNKVDSDYKIIIKTEAQIELDAPSIEIKEPIENENAARRLKEMIDYKSNIFNTLTISFDNTKYDYILYLNNVKIYMIKFSLTNLKYTYQYSIDDYMVVKYNNNASLTATKK